MTSTMPANPELWDPSISFRLERGSRDAILALRPALGGIESATMSATLRELLRLALVVFEPSLARRVAAVARSRGLSGDAAWRQVVEAGVSRLESHEED